MRKRQQQADPEDRYLELIESLFKDPKRIALFVRLWLKSPTHAVKGSDLKWTRTIVQNQDIDSSSSYVQALIKAVPDKRETLYDGYSGISAISDSFLRIEHPEEVIYKMFIDILFGRCALAVDLDGIYIMDNNTFFIPLSYLESNELVIYRYLIDNSDCLFAYARHELYYCRYEDYIFDDDHPRLPPHCAWSVMNVFHCMLVEHELEETWALYWKRDCPYNPLHSTKGHITESSICRQKLGRLVASVTKKMEEGKYDHEETDSQVYTTITSMNKEMLLLLSVENECMIDYLTNIRVQINKAHSVCNMVLASYAGSSSDVCERIFGSRDISSVKGAVTESHIKHCCPNTERTWSISEATIRDRLLRMDMLQVLASRTAMLTSARLGIQQRIKTCIQSGSELASVYNRDYVSLKRKAVDSYEEPAKKKAKITIGAAPVPAMTRMVI